MTFDTLNSEILEAGAFALLSACLKENSPTCTGLFTLVKHDLVTFHFKRLIADVPRYAAGRREVQEAGKDVIKKKYKLMNGLLLLSKHPIEMPVFHEIPVGRTQAKEDSLARKGIIAATVVLPGDLRFRVGLTHANCNLGGWSPAHAADLAYWTVMGAETGPAIMMGDFNVNGMSAAKYDQMAGIFAGVGALDAVKQLNMRDFVTVDGEKNLLCQYFFPKKPDSEFEASRLDHVFYRPDGPGLILKPESAKVITDWKYVPADGKNVEMDLSDHYPVMVTFSLWTGPKPIIP